MTAHVLFFAGLAYLIGMLLTMSIGKKKGIESIPFQALIFSFLIFVASAVAKFISAP